VNWNVIFAQHMTVKDLQLPTLFSNQNSMEHNAVFEVLNPAGRFPLILTCEHASHTLPEDYQGLGIHEDELQRHIGWDIGAKMVVSYLSRTLDAPAVCSGYSRLLIDCNRDLEDHDLIVEESDGTKILGNVRLSDAERQKRIDRFYSPYHHAIDELLVDKKDTTPMLLSIHSFTPIMHKKERRFDLGVLFDRFDDLAYEVGKQLQHTGHSVRYNEPYSGYDGLIFSARSHGERHGLVYLELEVNNRLINNSQDAAWIGAAVSRVCQNLLGSPKER
jgi:predicted N-formylglutamate amidohydrolase